MDKWKEFRTYENWKASNYSSLKSEYDEYIDENYTWVQPLTYVEFDDFCMGTWQSL